MVPKPDSSCSTCNKRHRICTNCAATSTDPTPQKMLKHSARKAKFFVQDSVDISVSKRAGKPEWSLSAVSHTNDQRRDKRNKNQHPLLSFQEPNNLTSVGKMVIAAGRAAAAKSRQPLQVSLRHWREVHVTFCNPLALGLRL